ncbi:MAG: RtcB family protein [Alphaproteobacteria bacterium]|nr:MAG: RtcB family protein [Alphaproteobacteria bacterium]
MAQARIFGRHDERTLAQMDRCMQVGSVAGGVLCADGHLGYAHPIGGVIAYEDHVSISGVGFDIGCGNLAARLDVKKSEIEDRVGTIVRDIAGNVSFGLGRTNAEKVEHPLFDDEEAWNAAAVQDLKAQARNQLGTVGSGNHYVDLFEDEEGFVWIGVHFGSRGLGHKSATKYLKQAGGRDGMDVEPALVRTDSELGERYLAAMELAGSYAYAGREWVVDKVRSILGANSTDAVHNHHNYAWREEHFGRKLWVVRKGATPAFPGQRGFVGGSMGDDAVILEGIDGEKSRAALYSTIHGAGRVMSRTEARGRFQRDPATGKKIRMPGRVRHDEMLAWLRQKGVLLIGGGLDEAPQAYRRLPDVLAEHEGTVRVLHTLRPFAVIMAGEKEFDPYKD